MSANHEQSHAVDHGHEGGLNTKMIWKVFKRCIACYFRCTYDR